MPTVKDLMTANPSCCRKDSALMSVAQMMCKENVGEIPVCENDRPIGVITDRDIVCRSLGRGHNPMELKASDCMSPNPITCRHDADLGECISLMEEHRIRRVPVVDEAGRLVGIVALADLARKAPGKVTEVMREVSHA